MNSYEPYEGQAKLGALVREAAKAAVHDETDVPDFVRLNNILTGEKFVDLLGDLGCMVTRIPRESRYHPRDS